MVSAVNGVLRVGAAMMSENWACLREQHMLAAHPVFTPEQALVKWNGWTSALFPFCPLVRDKGVRYLPEFIYIKYTLAVATS